MNVDFVIENYKAMRETLLVSAIIIVFLLLLNNKLSVMIGWCLGAVFIIGHWFIEKVVKMLLP
jgi:hypothetical protein